MIERCEKQNDPRYHNYGGRGITICKSWRNDFTLFCKWAREHGYEPWLTIDRIDNDGNYEPNNCRWVDRKTQARNRRTNAVIEFRGESKPSVEWAENIGINPQTLAKRLKSGWSVEKALTTPLNISKSRTLRHKRGQGGKP